VTKRVSCFVISVVVDSGTSVRYLRDIPQFPTIKSSDVKIFRRGFAGRIILRWMLRTQTARMAMEGSAS
jgi:hypothetical protein